MMCLNQRCFNWCFIAPGRKYSLFEKVSTIKYEVHRIFGERYFHLNKAKIEAVFFEPKTLIPFSGIGNLWRDKNVPFNRRNVI